MPALLIIGVVIILGGGVLFAVWFEYLWQLVKALLPLALIGVGGVIAYFGWEEKKDRKGAFLDFSSPTEASRYQAEALAYQEKINGFSEETGPSDPVAFDGGPAPAPEPVTRIEISDGSPAPAEDGEPEESGNAPGSAADADADGSGKQEREGDGPGSGETEPETVDWLSPDGSEDD
ncbi:MAG: hypothetical protein LBQ79_10805 [Deltaproteobacteria bacterium]|jgi:hypothetical protein|nr:hypothetical protein [Deltaproteobacteria bacterium]